MDKICANKMELSQKPLINIYTIFAIQKKNNNKINVCCCFQRFLHCAFKFNAIIA